MTYAALRLEVIGEYYQWVAANRKNSKIVRHLPLREEINIIRYGQRKFRPWVARLTGLDNRFGFQREFLVGMRDYSRADARCFRGIFEYFSLFPGVYEINECIKPGQARRYFVRVEDAQIIEIGKEEVGHWLAKNH